MLKNLHGQVLAVQEEVDMMKCEGAKSPKPKDGLSGRIACIRMSGASFDKKEYALIKPTINRFLEYGKKRVKRSRKLRIRVKK